MSYTKGKWRVLNEKARGRPRCLIVDARGDEIAAVNPYREAWNDNAQIIAATPAMYEALKRIKEEIVHEYGNTNYQSNYQYIDAAIKQAEGGE